MRAISLGIISVASAGTPVSVGSTVATVSGTEVETFAIVLNTNDQLLIGVDGGTPQPVALTAGAAQTAANVVSDINGQTTGLTASVAGGRVVVSSNTSGAGSSINVQSPANSANATIGFTVGTSRGSKDQVCGKIRITPMKANSGDVFVGNKVNFDKTTGDGLVGMMVKPLASPPVLDAFVVESQSDADVIHTKDYFVDAATSGDKVLVVIWVV